MNEMSGTGLAQSAGPATPEQIQELPRRYAIGKRPLSRLLGWGELTYTRLLDGGVPNAAHSDEIRRLLDDPAAYARLLEIGREHKIITGAAYDKSRRAVDALLAESGHDEAGDPLKIFAVADRICALTRGDVTPRTLQMLMRVAQERAREAGGEALFEQEPIAVDWGFEYPQIAAGYSFEAIQGVAARLRGLAVALGDIAPEDIAPAEPEPARGLDAATAEAEPEAEPEPEPIGKKGKKAKKDKKGKGKKAKKDKKAKKAAKLAAEAAVAAAAPAIKPAPAPAPEPAPVSAPSAVPRGPLSPAECRIVDAVVARYQQNLAAAFE